MVDILFPTIENEIKEQLKQSSTEKSLNMSETEVIKPATEEMDTSQPVVKDPVDIEDGELPEDGEIMDEDEGEPTKPIEQKSHREKEPSSSKYPPKKAFVSSFPSKSLPTSQKSSGHPKYKDYDSKVATKSSTSMLDSWVSGIQKKSGKSGSPDPNEEYYGTEKKDEGQASAEDVDLRGLPASGESAGDKDQDLRLFDIETIDHGRGDRDRDYRRSEEDRHEASPNRSPRYREERRRRRSPSPDDYRSKRSRDVSPPYYRDRRREPREREPREPRGPPPPPRKTRWTEHTICKFFREGYCRDADNCAYSHNAADSHRRPELCKFYQNGYCKKGLHCPLLHGEFPCKAFHKGECSKDHCQYSHAALNEFTQPIFDQMIKDDELAAKIMIPNQPLRRKVLLPAGPDPNQPIETPVIDPVTGQLAPPKVVVPVLASQSNYPGYEPGTTSFGFFNPITPSQPQPVSQNVLAAQQTASLISSLLNPKPPSDTPLLPTPSSIIEAATRPKSPQQEISTGFNINQMLEKITQGVMPGFTTEIDESPASPPMFDTLSVVESTNPMMIPSSQVRPWKLYVVDVEPSSMNFDISFMQRLATNSKNDPRLKKLAEKQFDMVSALIQRAPVEKQIVTQTYSPSTGTVTTMMSPSGAASSQQTSQVLTQTIPSRDPRMRDPRKKALAQTPASGGSSILSLPMPPTVASTPAAQPSSSYTAPTTSASVKSLDDETFESMVEWQIQMANQMAQQQSQDSGDVDHRQLYAPSSSTIQSSLYAPIAPRVPGANGSPRSDFGYNSPNNSYRAPRPRYNNPADPRAANYYNNNQGNYSPNWGDNGYTSPPSESFGATSLPIQLFSEITTSTTASTTSTSTSSAPLSLREKRKNNEYESPLGRARAAY